MFKFTSETRKIKVQVLSLSVVCLFSSIAKALPKKIGIIDYDFSANEEVFGWFLFFITVLFSVKFLVLGLLDILREYHPNLAVWRSRGVTGEYTGLNKDEIFCVQEESCIPSNDDSDPLSADLAHVKREEKEIEKYWEEKYIILRNSYVFLADFLFPVLFSFYSVYSLFCFIQTYNSPIG
ncbi:MAG: hypothetical protein D3917_21020 [Candidatus Electrothrix sp. AX5]|nr:hypothetical protein [Candidatus Electrothrix sp. AX5]